MHHSVPFCTETDEREVKKGILSVFEKHFEKMESQSTALNRLKVC